MLTNHIYQMSLKPHLGCLTEYLGTLSQPARPSQWTEVQSTVLLFRYLGSSPLFVEEKARRHIKWPTTGKTLIWCLGHGRRGGGSGKFRDAVLMDESPGTISPMDCQLQRIILPSFWSSHPLFRFSDSIHVFLACPHFHLLPSSFFMPSSLSTSLLLFPSFWSSIWFCSIFHHT